jgi:hypothetical protein
MEDRRQIMRTRTRFSMTLLWTVAGAGLILAAAVPATAAATPRAATTPAEPAVLANPCGPALPLFGDLDAWLLAPSSPRDGEGTPVAAPPTHKRFCACGCGAPCTTDEDCGFGGLCISGITCCAVPGGDLDPTAAKG